MLTLNGRLVHIYETPTGVNKKTGEEYGGKDRIQLLCFSRLKNGEKQGQMVDLTVDDARFYKDLMGKELTVPVGVMAIRSNIIYYVTGQPVSPTAKQAV